MYHVGTGKTFLITTQMSFHKGAMAHLCLRDFVAE